MPIQGPMPHRLAKGAAIIVVFLGLSYGLPVVVDWIDPPTLVNPFGIHHYSWMSTEIVLSFALLLLAMAILRGQGPVAALKELGFLPVPMRPIVLGLAAVAAMAVVLAAMGQTFGTDSIAGLIMLGIVSPVAEELLFRGFAFRELGRWAGAPFWIAALISSALFGAEHLSQGSNPSESLMAFGVTFLGGVLLCWVAERWQTLWLGIVLHIGLNSVWTLFTVSDNAIGNLAGNVARLAAIAIAIAGTLVLTRRPVPLASGA